MLSFTWISASSAQDSTPHIRLVQVFEPDQTDLSNPAGLAFSPRANTFQVVEAPAPSQPPPAATDVVQLTPFGDRAGSARIAAAIRDPINTVFDSRFQRLLLFQSPNNMLVEVLVGPDGELDPASMVRHDARHFGLLNPQGMAVDPANGDLYILDATGPRILQVEPEPDGSFEDAVITVLNLGSSNLVDPRGLAFDPTSGHLHVVNTAEGELYELTQTGQVVTTRNLSEFGIRDPQGMVFAPSGDQTDDPAALSLYLADRGRGVDLGQRRLSLHSGQTDAQPAELSTGEQSSGQIVELSFTALAAPATSTFTSSLVNIVDTSQWSPPSPDPSGLAYISSSNRLIMDDGEVEETVSGITHFEGANVWELTLDGAVLDTANISKVDPTLVPMTNEPTGIAWNPNNGHFYVTQDNGDAVFDWDIGGDGQIGTSDDRWTSFDTGAAGNGDAEGIAYDSWNNHLFVADGVNGEVYEYTLSGSLVNHFDVIQYGVVDPESVEFNPASGTLFVMSSDNSFPVVVETTTSGDLLQTIDISATNARAAAGLTYVPASDGTGVQRFYIVDRGVDNNGDPNIIDGLMYELTAPEPTTPGNLPPEVDAGPDQSIILPNDATLDGTVSDDGNPDPPRAVTTNWSQVSGPGVVTFGDASAIDTTASFSNAGSYVLRLTASDGEWTPSDEVTITVNPDPSVPILEVRVAASSDDAEEDASGNMSIGSSDLELVYDGSNQTVGMRFNGIDIPQGANILKAYLQFQVDETDTEATGLIIEGEDSDNAATFVSSSGNISSRPRTSASAAWSPAPWTVVGEAGFDQRTPDIAAVVQEIVTRPGWAGGNSLAIIITGTGLRTAESFNGDQAGAPLLHVEYIASGNNNPGVTINLPAEGSTFNEGNSITFSGMAGDVEDGDLTASLVWESNIDGPIGIGGSFLRSDLSVGAHTITARVTDSGGQVGVDTIQITVFADTNILVGAGDIAYCNSLGDEQTAALLDDVPGTVFTLGDNAYEDGTEADFNNCYDPTWGRHKARTRPTPGNHDYHTIGASGYFNYFGTSAGEAGKGYYSYEVGDWHVIVLNSECSDVGGCDRSSPQGQWLQADLAANPRACTLAYWHSPLFSSDSLHGNNTSVQDFWSLLYESGADVVLNGHAHTYERFAPQDPNGAADSEHGIREFVVGTGGKSLFTFGAIQPNSEVRYSDTYGVLKLGLHPGSYDWEFIPVNGGTFTDSGSAACIGIGSGNTAPLAVDDAYTTDEDTLLTVAAPGVLDNDTDAENDPLTALLNTGPGNGTLTLNADGSFSYTPNPNFNGSDSFTYHANDGLVDSNLSTVSITVTAVNDPPVADANGPYAGTTGIAVQFDGSTSSDVDGTIVSYDWDFGDGTTGTSPNPTHTYAVTGTYTVVLTVTDNGGATDSGTTSANIQSVPNQPPVAGDDAYATGEDTVLAVTAPGVLGNDTDADGDSLTAALVSEVSNGTLSLNADGSFTYTPNADFNGADSFTYTANDGQNASNITTVSITVNAVNDPPVAVYDAYTAEQDTRLNVAPAGVLANDGDVDGDGLSAALVSGVSNGTLTLNEDGSFSYTPEAGFTGTDGFTYIANDGVLDSNAATVTITVNPSAPVTFEVRVAAGSDDAEENTSGRVSLTSSDLELVLEKTIQVVGLRFNGVLIPPGATITNATLQFQADETNSQATDLIIRAQAADNPATFVGGTSGDISGRPTTSAAVSWAPPPWNTKNEQGLDQRSTDFAPVIQEIVNRPGWASGNSVVIIITGSGKRVADSYNGSQAGAPLLHVEYTTGLPNNQPIANVDSASTPEDTTVMVDVVANDTDPDGNLAPATANTACATCADPSHGTLVHNGDGTFDYTPNANFNGTDGFVYEICDALGACDTASVSITVTSVNDPPVAHDDSASTRLDTPVTVNVADNDTDIESNLDPGSVTVSNAPTNGAAASNPDGTITYTPDPTFNGNDSFTYRICDTGGLCDTASVVITVNPSAPVTFEVRVAASSDDAEENTSGRVSLTSSDLELVLESSIQTVGMRFSGVLIPPGATITNATLQFQADETNSEATDLIIRAQAADNPATFIGGSGGDISSRPTTSAAASWAPPPWNTKNEQGPDQRSTDFAPVIQEIVNRPGWTSGNSVVIIITGSGKRVADSYDGDPAGAPLLHVEYFSP